MRLARVLRQIAHDAGVALLCRGDPQRVRFCAGQYNRIRTRLAAMNPELASACPLLPGDASAGCIRVAARALALQAEALAREERERASSWTGWFGWFCPGCRLQST